MPNENDPGSNTWKPNEELVQVTRDEIHQKFKENKIDNDFVEICSKIGAFLMDKEEVMKGLQRLNDEILEKVANPEEYKQFVKEFISTTNKKNQKEKISNPELRKKLQVGILVKILNTELGKAGFEPEFAKALGFVDAPLFRKTIKHGLLTKDVGLGVLHGEFAHAIQWLLIIWQQEKTHFLGNNVKVIDIFKKLGEEQSVFNELGIAYFEKGIWDLIVDRTSRENNPKLDKDDLRNPDNLTGLIKSDVSTEKIPALKAIVSSRTIKRDELGSSLLFMKPEINEKKYVKSESDSLLVPKNNSKDFKK